MSNETTVAEGEWNISYGEIFTGGDMVLYSAESGRHIATFQRHGDELSAEDNAISVNTAELIKRTPDLLSLVQHLATVDPHTDPEEFDELQRDAVTLLTGLYREWGEPTILPTTHTCEYTPDGLDSRDACGKPATISNPWLDADYQEWYCTEHADPAWTRGACEDCDHRYVDHAFFPNGEPAPLCVANDVPPVTDACDCEGYISPAAGALNEVATR